MEKTPENKEKSGVASEIERLFEQDQEDIEKGQLRQSEDLEELKSRWADRLERAREIYEMHQRGNVQLSPEAKYQLAIVFQHGENAADIEKAYDLARSAEEQGYKPSRNLAAAAEDRYLRRKGEKQRWGTQYERNESGEWERAPMLSDDESGITDQMRKERGVMTREEQLKAVERLRRETEESEN